MSVPVLSCPCGLRMKAKGATPGRVGRCPKCGRTLKVPDAPEAEPVVRGYGVHSSPSPTPPIAAEADGPPVRSSSRKRKVGRPVPVEVSREAGPYWRPDLLFPLRGAEGLVIVVMLGLASWFVTVLIPELCLTFVADASKFGASLMGWLVSLVAALPALVLGPLAITYALQYNGRVLVSAAMGEVVPPRPPDRNFDGLFHGLGPWVVWLAFGASIGLGPLAAYVFSRSGDEPMDRGVVLLLGGLGLPYALMSLMMTFLQDGGIPHPFAVVATLMRRNLSFLAVCAMDLALGLVAWWAFGVVYSLRDEWFWTYILAALPAWVLAHWSAVVVMRGLGVYYHHHASALRWHRETPWWSVTPGT